MCDKTNAKKRKKAAIMATFAKPNTSSYIVKKECVPIIVGKKNSPASIAKMQEYARIFKINNLQMK